MEIPVLDITDKTQDKIENLSESGCLVIKMPYRRIQERKLKPN